MNLFLCDKYIIITNILQTILYTEETAESEIGKIYN